MNLIVVGISHHKTPLAVREEFSFTPEQASVFLNDLKGQGYLEGVVLVSTCNRVEVYATSEEPQALNKLVHSLKAKSSRAPLEDSMVYAHESVEAVKHVFKVVSSLDSLVLGEPQILGQVKESYFLSKSLNLLDSWLEKVLQKSFSVAKKIRNETEIGERAISISYVAVTLAKKIFSDMSKRQVLILGAGEMAELCAQHLKSLNPKKLLFATRTYQNAVDLAQTYGGVAVPLESLQENLNMSDITIVSTSADSYVIKPEHVEKALEERRQEPMFLIDISVPRNVDPAINQLDNVYLYNIDDLQTISEANRKIRHDEAQKALEIIHAESERTVSVLKKLDFGYLIENVKKESLQLQAREMERIQKALKHLSAEDLQVIERGLQSYGDKMLHAPIRFFTQADEEDAIKNKADLFARIFGIHIEMGSKEET